MSQQFGPPKIFEEAGYIEALPSIEAAQALRECMQGRSVCWWRNEDNIRVGEGLVGLTSTTQLSLRYSFGNEDPSLVRQGYADLELVYITAGQRSRRAAFICPGCGAKVAKLHLHGTQFKCRRCTGLPYRRHRMSAMQVKAEKLQHLDSLIGGGRPPMMRNAKYHALQAERTKLMRLLRGSSVKPSREKPARIVLSEWVRADFGL